MYNIIDSAAKMSSFVDEFLKEAATSGVDRLYLDCLGESGACRFQKNGDIVKEFPIEKYLSVLNQIKIIFGLDVGENRIPQQWEPHEIDLHDGTSTCKALPLTLPTQNGECVIIDFFYDQSISRNRISQSTLKEIGQYSKQIKGGLVVLSSHYPNMLNRAYCSVIGYIAGKKLQILSIDENFTQSYSPTSKEIKNVAHLASIPKAFEMPITLNAALKFYPEVITINNLGSDHFDRLTETLLFAPPVSFIVSTAAANNLELARQLSTYGINIIDVLRDEMPGMTLYTTFYEVPFKSKGEAGNPPKQA